MPKTTKTTKPELPAERTKDLQVRVDDVLKRMSVLRIASPADAEAANAFLVDVKSTAKFVTETLKPGIDALKKPYDKARQEMKALIDPLENAETIIKTKLKAFLLLEQARIAEAAEKAAAKTTRAFTRQGYDPSEAKEMALAVAAASAPTPTALPGSTLIPKWEAQVSDLRELLDAILKGKAPISYIKLDQSYANAQAEASKGKDAPPGLSFVNVGTIRTSVK